MSEKHAVAAASHVLRIAVRGSDPLRASALVSALAAAGHLVVQDSVADVLVLDQAATLDEADAARAVSVGGAVHGAAALLPRGASIEQVDAAIRAVAAGLIVRSPRGDDGRFAAADMRHGVLLTPREIEVLRAIADGLGNKEIARRLNISLHTVKFHVESMFRKLGARSRAEAVTKGWDILHGAIEL